MALAIEARDNLNASGVLVAGGISYWSWSGYQPSLAEMRENGAIQAKTMADAGADLIMLEMMVDTDKMCALLEGVLTVELPVWVGFSCRRAEDGQLILYGGEPLLDGVKALRGYGLPLISIMHTDVGCVSAALDLIRNEWDGFIGVYAHTGDFDENDSSWIPGTGVSEAVFCDYAKQWREAGVNLIGGCCGVGVGYIERLAADLSRSG